MHQFESYYSSPVKGSVVDWFVWDLDFKNSINIFYCISEGTIVLKQRTERKENNQSLAYLSNKLFSAEKHQSVDNPSRMCIPLPQI